MGEEGGRLLLGKWPIEEENTVLSEIQRLPKFDENQAELLHKAEFNCLQHELMHPQCFALGHREGDTVGH